MQWGRKSSSVAFKPQQPHIATVHNAWEQRWLETSGSGENDLGVEVEIVFPGSESFVNSVIFFEIVFTILNLAVANFCSVQKKRSFHFSHHFSSLFKIFWESKWTTKPVLQIASNCDTCVLTPLVLILAKRNSQAASNRRNVSVLWKSFLINRIRPAFLKFFAYFLPATLIC